MRLNHDYPPSMKGPTRLLFFYINNGEILIPSCSYHCSPATTPLLADDQSTSSAALGGEYDICYLYENNVEVKKNCLSDIPTIDRLNKDTNEFIRRLC